MFEALEGDATTVDKASYEKREAKLRSALLDAQYRILEAKRFPVVVVIAGVEGAGKGETVNLLTEWMDPRHIHAHAVGDPTDEETQRPPMWRFWRRLPPKGKVGVFFGSWYTMPIVEHVAGHTSKKDFEAALQEVRRFETMLVREGALVVKYWFHLSKKAQKKRLEELAGDKYESYRVTKDDWRRLEHYDDYRRASERALTSTWSDDAPWTLVDGRDPRGRALFVGESLLSAMSDRLKQHDGRAKPSPAIEAKKAKSTLLARVDLSPSVAKAKYEKELLRLQRELALLTRKKGFQKLSPVLVFEGADAAGKGGAIRRITRALDARVYDVFPVAAPTDEERAQPYLWRFWRNVPRDGKFAIFDRSWYGRVLVERVEGFASEPDWRRAYEEINDFELQLTRAGCPVVKLWLQISPDEQLRRFKEREQIKWKRFKITEEDWRNRDKWPAYQVAASEMIERTSTDYAPWTVIAAEDKYHARIAVLRTVCAAIARAL